MDMSKTRISIAGEFAVLSQLALRGFDANMTLGNTKSVDILISNPKTGRMVRLEVKTSFGRKPSRSNLFGHVLYWMMSEKHETITDPNLYYCFVNIESSTSTIRYFIIPSKIVADYVKNQHVFWLKNKQNLSNYEKSIPMRQFRVGLEERGYKISTPLAKDYENSWNILE